jgi:ABC-type branched-subunit amino acid transport system ATPase component
MTVLENVLLAAPKQSREGVWGALMGKATGKAERAIQSTAGDALAIVGLSGKASESAEALSYGEQKLVTIACCLATGADIILLDEPVAGIAPSMTDHILDNVRKLPSLGKTVLFIEHNLTAVQAIAETVIVMAEGRAIAEGTWGDVSNQGHVLDAYLA